MAAFWRMSALAVALWHPRLALGADSCKSEEQEESALLAHRSVSLAVGGATVNGTQCGLIFCASDAVCCKDSRGNGICGSPGSVCCPSSLTGGTTICAPGNQCNRKSGLCFSPNEVLCGTIACAPGSVCCDSNPTAPLCGAPGTACCISDQNPNIVNLCAQGTSCHAPTGSCFVPIPNTIQCTSKQSQIMIQCAAGSVCCDEGSAPLCLGAGSICCKGPSGGVVGCPPGSNCTDTGICESA